MTYRILADLVVFVHLGFVLFVAFGGILVFRWRSVLWVHVPAVVWGILIEFAGWTCPLTPLENWLRSWGRERGYEGGFVEHYLVSILYPETLPRGFQIILGFAVLLINLIVYWRVFSHQRYTR